MGTSSVLEFPAV